MANGSGFGGSGFKFDQSEAGPALKKEKRQAAKAAGLIVEDDNDDDDENMDNYDDDDGGGDMKWGAAGLSSVSAIEGANAMPLEVHGPWTSQSVHCSRLSVAIRRNARASCASGSKRSF